MFQNPNDILDRTIQEENHIVNESIDVNLDFGDYGNENSEPLALGSIEDLSVPLNTFSQTIIRQAFAVERSSPNSKTFNPPTSNATATSTVS